jgi:hypothetical protein
MFIVNKDIAQILLNKQFQKFNKYIKNKKIQQKKHSYSPDKNGKKYLVIMACHCDSDIKLDTIRNNLLYFAFESCDKIVINSKNLQHNQSIKEICLRHLNTKYFEIENDKRYFDYGKWINVLTNLVNYNDYDYIVFTNDSFTIHSSINHFLNLAVKHNVELYGYNDSTQTRYHYQSYLFILRKDAIPLFINKVTAPNLILNCQSDVILHFEVKMTDWFTTHKSFLKIGNFGLEKGHNIFFTNDALYLPLKNSGLLPFTKLKRII